MTTPNWSLLQGGAGFQNALATGMQFGQMIRQRQDEKEYKNALAQYDPTNPETLKPVMAVDPRLGLQLQQQQAAQAGKRAEQRRADLPMMGKLLQFASQGPEQWQQALGVAQEYGIDTSNIPQQFDPEWAKSQSTVLQTLSTPEGQEALSTAGKIAVDMGFKPGTPEYANKVREVWLAGESKPYVVGGETRLYTPKIGGVGEAQGGIPPAAAAELRANPGTAAQFDEIFGQGAAARILGQGGQTATPSATFSGGFRGVSGERVTSTFRTPEHNKAVGGVARSYHMRRYPDGSPMARDSVPPPGMSMAAYADVLRRQNPHLEVINEGDHVHMEPRG